MSFRRAAPSLLVTAYVVLWFLVGLLPIVANDLDIFFWPAARVALAGHPLSAYAPHGLDLYPNANGPLSLLPLTAVGAVVRALGWLDSVHLRRAVTLAIFSLFILLMAREAVAAIDRLRGRRLDIGPRLLAYGALTLGAPLWQSLAVYGHIEQAIEVWLVLLAVRWLTSGWFLQAGIAVGLTLLTRSAAALFWLPLALHAWRRGGPTRVASLVLSAAVTGLAGLLPFFIADPADLTHSLFTYRTGLPVYVGSIWSVARGTPLEALGQHYDIVFVGVLALVMNLWLASRPGGFTEQRLFAAMALTAACLVLLAKTVWPYYFMELYVIGTVWAIGRWRSGDGVTRLVVPSVAITVFGLIADIGSVPGIRPGPVAVEGVAMFFLLGTWMVWTARIASSSEGEARLQLRERIVHRDE